jgi:protein SCO1
VRVALIVAASLLSACSQRSHLEVMSQLQPFQLTSQTGRPFDSKSLEGHVWVADFFFTSCPGPCPMMSQKLGEIQRQTADLPDVKIVSFTVDPSNDTPAALTAYAKRFKADSVRWYFLTGDLAALNDIGRNGFKLNSVDGSTVHSTRFALVDKRMQVRGYYSTDEDGFMPKLIRDIRNLAAGRS